MIEPSQASLKPISACNVLESAETNLNYVPESAETNFRLRLRLRPVPNSVETNPIDVRVSKSSETNFNAVQESPKPISTMYQRVLKPISWLYQKILKPIFILYL